MTFETPWQICAGVTKPGAVSTFWMRAKSLFCLSVTNITHVHCNIYSNIFQIEKIWKNIVYFCFKYAFVEDIEKAEKDSVSGPDNPDIPGELLGLVRTRFLSPTPPLSHGPGETGEQSLTGVRKVMARGWNWTQESGTLIGRAWPVTKLGSDWLSHTLRHY